MIDHKRICNSEKQTKHLCLLFSRFVDWIFNKINEAETDDIRILLLSALSQVRLVFCFEKGDVNESNRTENCIQLKEKYRHTYAFLISEFEASSQRQGFQQRDTGK